MTPEQIVEATLFSSQTPLTPAEIARADRTLDIESVERVIQTLRERYETEEHAFQIYQLGDGYQLLTRPEFAPYLEQFDSVPRSPTLSQAALETLAIIAYRQPIGRVEIEDVRGVSASSVLKTLLDWELIEVVARGEGLGRPLLYGVSRVFLDHFGLQNLSDLPDPESLPVRLKELADREAERNAVDEAPNPEAVAEEQEVPGIEAESAKGPITVTETDDEAPGRRASSLAELKEEVGGQMLAEAAGATTAPGGE